MAKKTSAAAKKVVKKTAPVKAKPVDKKKSKVVAKPEKKAAAKPAAKVSAAKPVKKEVVKPVAVSEKTKPKDLKASVKSAVKSKPAIMSKPAEDVVVEEIAVEEEVSSAKAEKVSKFKPIRIEKGNAADEKAKWAELFKKYGKEKAATYKMSDTFLSLNPISHKVLGWGFILSNDNDRLEVLFETGIRMLISNYKS